VVIEEAGSNSKVRITNYEDILLKKHGRKKKKQYQAIQSLIPH
jgi:hypothetical protein